MPVRVRAKSYLAGSSAQISRNPSVISIAVRKSALFLFVNPNSPAILCICTSVGTTNSLGLNTSQPPGSTLSFLTIHFKYRNNLLHALPSRGAVISENEPSALPHDSLSENLSRPAKILPLESFRHSPAKFSILSYLYSSAKRSYPPLS